MQHLLSISKRSLYVLSYIGAVDDCLIICPQVPFFCLRRRHFLLLCWDDFCCSWHTGTLQQNDAAVFPSTSGELCLLSTPASPHHPLSQAPAPQVSTDQDVKFFVQLFGSDVHLFFIFWLSLLHFHTRLNADTGKLGMSYAKFKRKDVSKLGHMILKVKIEFLNILFYIYYDKHWCNSGH